jgi:hypothetical protein
MNEQEKAEKKLKLLGRCLRNGLLHRSGYSTKVFMEAVRAQFPKDKEKLLKDLEERSKTETHPELQPHPKPAQKRGGKKPAQKKS